METKFKYGPFDRRSRRITIVIISIIMVAFGALLYFEKGSYFPAWFMAMAISTALLYILSIPRNVIINDNNLEIHCVLELTTIPIRNLKTIRKVSKQRLKYTFPLLGSYGFFGYYGYYFNLRGWKIIKIYARQWSNFVKIEDIYEQTYIISCPDADELIHAVRELKKKSLEEDI